MIILCPAIDKKNAVRIFGRLWARGRNEASASGGNSKRSPMIRREGSRKRWRLRSWQPVGVFGRNARGLQDIAGLRSTAWSSVLSPKSVSFTERIRSRDPDAGTKNPGAVR